ncbi:MAG: hypothetical protein MUO92_02580 [Dehalococcoidales bacterium]|nr:hypothetical protein [Dehalococcoidales bacterium]
MTGGYTGKILRLNLTKGSVDTIDTSNYEEYGGGHGIGSAIFWDLCEDKAISAFDPRNVVTMMTSPLAGTLTPSTGRCEVQGIAPLSYPIEWFTRSNFGGRFACMLKAAGWDGIVIEGKADNPVWINIINGNVTIEDAAGLWGKDTYDTQLEVWRLASETAKFDKWLTVDDSYTTQRPAVVCIGPAGEALVRYSVLLHDGGMAAGHTGFGAVFGSKNLKAISVFGTGSVTVADPEALIDARLWLRRKWGRSSALPYPTTLEAVPPEQATFGPSGCQSCASICRTRYNSALGNDVHCAGSGSFGVGAMGSKVSKRANDLVQRLGVNPYQGEGTLQYLTQLYQKGILGPGKAIDSAPLVSLDKYGTYEFHENFLNTVVNREGIGELLADGIMRAAKQWGRLEEDLDSGILPYPNWGFMSHWVMPQAEWPYSNLLGDRDINEHDFNFTWTIVNRITDVLPADKVVEILAEKTVPYTGDTSMFDYSDGPTGIYSDGMVKRVAWSRHSTRFWKQSALYCDWAWPSFIVADQPDFKGASPEAEPKFFNAVTGKNITYADGVEIGRKIWNLDRAIWILQGRHRDMEKFAPFLMKPQEPGVVPNRNMYTDAIAVPIHKDGAWSYALQDWMDLAHAYKGTPMYIDETRFEEWRTKFYEFEGWETSSGWPKRATLEELGLGFVADELESKGKLGT